MTMAYDPHADWAREDRAQERLLLTTDQLAEAAAYANARISERRARERDQPAPWPGFTSRCTYACRRGCDH